MDIVCRPCGFETLIMSTAIQLLGFLMCLAGWLLSFMSLVNDSWRTSSFVDQLVTSVWYYQNLWQTCAEGSTGVTNCKQFESMLSLSGNTHTPHTHTLEFVHIADKEVLWWYDTSLGHISPQNQKEK